jgi:DNA-binding IscR family transcriptional regulator
VSDDIDHGLAILRQLRHSYPARVAEADLLRTVAQSEKVGLESLRPTLTRLMEEGLVQSSKDGAGVTRLVVSSKGISMLEGLEPLTEGSGTISPWEMESKLIATYDSMKTDMEALKKNLERSQKEFEKDVSEIRKSIADHDQFLRTYFVRIIESISVFIGVFGIVVVMMVSTLQGSLGGSSTTSMHDLKIFVIMLPLLLVLTIIPTLYLIKKVILQPNRPPIK